MSGLGEVQKRTLTIYHQNLPSVNSREYMFGLGSFCAMNIHKIVIDIGPYGPLAKNRLQVIQKYVSLSVMQWIDITR